MGGTLNKIMLIGNLGDDIKLHYFDNGNCIGRFPLATHESYTNKQTGERTTNTEWHNVVVRNKVAEIFEKYVSKGDKIYVEGRLKTRQWQGDDGNTRYSTEIHVVEFTFLTTKRDSQNNTQNTTSSDTTKETATNETSVETNDAEGDDLPF